MDNVLFVMNMQEFYVGKNRDRSKYPYNAEELIQKVNKRITQFEAEEVFYIISIGKGLFKGGMPKADTMEARIAKDIKIKSKNIYEKNKPDCYSNDALADFMRSRNVKNVEFVGVDTGTEIDMSAYSAIEDLDLRVTYNEQCIVRMAPEKATKYREKLRRTRVTFMQDWNPDK